ncbi:MAG: glycosyltransferase family 4 protein [Caldilineaceae bacterium]|nr:glycosyltransferase family 4 protein [Caldilineaceae bacterium]
MIAPTSFFADYGCHVRIYEEARILQALGHQVTIVTYRNGSDVPGLDIRRTLPIPWRRHYEVGSSRHKIAFDLLLGLKTLQLVLWRRYDVLHAHLHEGALIALIVARLFRIPVVFDFQGSLTEEMIDHKFLRRDSRFYHLMRRLENWINHSAPVIFPSSSEGRRILLEKFACHPDQVRTLSDRVDTDSFRPAYQYTPAALQQQRARFGIPSQAKVIVYLGLLAEYQGTGLLLEAMQRILKQRSDVYLLLMGFPGVDIYQQKATELGIQDRVIFTGRVSYREAAPLYLALGDVAVAPKLSLSESAGKLLNYMAVGLPTVAFETSVAREYLGYHGLLAERGNVQSLAEKVLAALEKPELGTALRQRAIQHFSWRAAADIILAAYDELTRPRRSKETLQSEWIITQK